jgi:TonB family protein
LKNVYCLVQDSLCTGGLEPSFSSDGTIKLAEISKPDVRSLGDSPGGSGIVLSVAVHLIAIALILVLRQATAGHVVPPKLQEAQLVPGSTRLAFSAKGVAQPTHPAPNRRAARSRASQSASAGTALQGLRKQARQETVAMVNNFMFRQVYGFNPGPDYQLANQTSGELPTISADQVPLHFQQFVIVEVTIDTQGKVADARIVAGVVEPPIQQTLLSAIREFKYRPATRDGVPIPSQKDLVIRVPS